MSPIQMLRSKGIPPTWTPRWNGQSDARRNQLSSQTGAGMAKFAAVTNAADSKLFIGGAALLGLNALSHCRTQWESGFVGPWVAHGPALDLIGFYSQLLDFDRAS
jgi:hypothetical protein